MPSSPPAAFSFTVALRDEQATRRLAADIANLIEPGDVITLLGDLGAGKSAFARAFIRHLAGDETAEVPSPTFTLMQSYDLPRFALVHADLYRLSGPDELTELGFDDEAGKTVMLIEWPERARGHLPEDRINVALMLDASQGDTYRHCKVTGLGKLAARVERIDAIRRFLDTNGFGNAARTRMQGDASSRMYERLTRDGESFILMNSPRRTDGPPVEGGKPYSAIAHLAEDVTPFIAMARALSEEGLSAPAIIAADRAAGLLILEDLGLETVVEGEPPAPIAERYGVATDLLAALHRTPKPNDLPVESGVSHRVPRFDLGAMLIEVSLLIDWYLPHRGVEPDAQLRAAYRALWTDMLKPALEEPPTWVLRDYHSPNLIWLPHRDGIKRIGLLDFQDAVMGPAAYDVASLLQDARVDVPEDLEVQLLVRYLRGREDEDGFARDAFVHLYALMAAQRASKILGIFARLDKRDGKPQYLRHLPRVWTYLQRALAHPALAPLAEWYDVHIPAPDMKNASIDTPHSAMVLAAGLGQRMRPLTETVPKPLVKVAGKALLDHVLDRLADAGVKQAIVNVHYLGDQIIAHVAARQSPEVVISDERGELLDTGGGVVKALLLLGDKPFFHINSDTIWIDGVQPNLTRLAERFDSDSMDGLLLLAPTAESIGYDGRGDFLMAPDGRLAWPAERAVAPFVFAGAAILSPRLFDGAPQGAFSLTRLFDKAIDAGRLYGLRLEGLWMHVGTPDAIGLAEEAIAKSTG